MLQKERLQNNYDLLRVFAALCITLTHSYNLIAKDNYEPLMIISKNSIDFSFVGLSIFFSISGYLIAKSAITSSSFKNYLWKRLLRIQPMLIVVCVISVFIIGPIFTSLSIFDYFKNFTTYTYFRNIMPIFGIQFILPNVFLNNVREAGVNGSMWTLVLEERLYIILGFLFLFKQKRNLLFIYSVLSFNILFFVHNTFFKNNFIEYLNGGHIFYAIVFLNASVFYLLSFDFNKYSNNWQLYLAIILALAVSVFFPFKISLQVILVPFLIILFAHLKCVTNKAGVYGDFTYGIYIFSFPVQQILITSNKYNNSPLGLFFTTLSIVIPIAFLCWHLIEKRILAYKEIVK